MKTYQLKEPTVQAAQITGVTYTLDDGSTKEDPADAGAVGSYYVVQNGQPDTVIPKDVFEAEYIPLAQ